MPLDRRHVRIPAAIALVAVAAFVVLWVGARTPFARGLIEARLSEATGLPARIGRLRIGLLPSPTLHLEGLSIAQPPGFDDAALLEIPQLRVALPWRSVFGAGGIDVVDADEPTLRLAVNAGGESNWSRFFREPVAGAEPAEPAEPAAWSLGTLAIARGTINYRDAATSSAWRLTAIKLAATGVRPRAEFPLELSLGGVIEPNTINFALKGRARVDPDAGRHAATALEFRGWIGGAPLPLAGAEFDGRLAEAHYATATGVLKLDGGQFELAEIPGSVEGAFNLDEPELAVELRVGTEPFEPRVPANIFGQPLPATADPSAFESLQLAFTARLRDDVLAIDPLSGRLDDTNFSGRAEPRRRLVRAELDRIDLNRYLPPEAKGTTSARKAKATLEEMIAELAAFELDAEIRIDEARIAGATVRDAVLRVEPDGEPPP